MLKIIFSLLLNHWFWAAIFTVFATSLLIIFNVDIPFLDQILQNTNSTLFILGTTKISIQILVKGILSITLLFWVASFLSSVSNKRIKALKKLSASNKTLAAKSFQITLYFFALMLALKIVGIDLTGLAIFGGAVGIGIGFGLQKITSNFISGIIILLEKSVEEGDLIELDNGLLGFIRQTNARYTLVETYDGREIMIPNEDLITNKVTNWTFSNAKGRIEINVGVAYGTNLKKAYQLILDAANNHPLCSKTNTAACFLDGFGDSSINFTLYFWVNDVIAGRKGPKSDVLFEIWEKFQENNIEIPFPQRDIHIKSSNTLT